MRPPVLGSRFGDQPSGALWIVEVAEFGARGSRNLTDAQAKQKCERKPCPVLRLIGV
jgi:hypothetical protein